MKKRVRLLTDFRLSEVSVVDHPACEKSAITSVQLVKRSESVEPELNPDALKAIDIQPDEVGPIRKFVRFLMTSPADAQRQREAKIDKVLGNLRKAMNEEPDPKKWTPILSDVATNFMEPDEKSHAGLIPPADTSRNHIAEPGKPMDPYDTGLGKDDMEDSAKTSKAISERSDVSPADRAHAESEYGDVTFADTKNKKYPIDTEGHIRAAWNYINKPHNAGKYSSEEVSQIKSKIVAAWKKKIDSAGPPSAAKAAGASKSLFDVSQFAQLVMGIDMCAQGQLMDGTLEQGDDADNELAHKICDLRDQAGQILIEMVQHEVGELGGDKMASANVEELAKSLLDSMRKRQRLEKKGAKFSAETTKCMKAASDSFTKASGYFGKASDNHPDDEDLNSGLTHFASGMYHMGKIDFEGKDPEGGMSDVSPNDADDPYDSANDADDKSEKSSRRFQRTIADTVAKAVASNLEKVQAQAHAFEVENAALRARLETLGHMPAKSTIKVGNPSLTSKTAADEALARQAGRSSLPEISIDPADDRKVTKGNVPVNFAKSFALARRDPVIITGKPSLGGGA